MGKLICQGALNKNITLSEMADFLPMSRSSFYSVLRGDKRLTLQEANTISGEFDLSLDMLAKAELETLKSEQHITSVTEVETKPTPAED